MYARWRDHVSFVHIYIREAHATDEWPLGRRVEFEQHKTQEARIQCAEKCWSDLDIQLPSVTDHIENDFNNAYWSWPERFYIVHEGRMQFIAAPRDAVYDPSEIDDWLQGYARRTGFPIPE